jgi:hypothetical protein
MPQERREGGWERSRGRPKYGHVRPLTEWTLFGQVERPGRIVDRWGAADGDQDDGEAPAPRCRRNQAILLACRRGGRPIMSK